MTVYTVQSCHCGKLFSSLVELWEFVKERENFTITILDTTTKWFYYLVMNDIHVYNRVIIEGHAILFLILKWHNYEGTILYISADTNIKFNKQNRTGISHSNNNTIYIIFMLCITILSIAALDLKLQLTEHLFTLKLHNLLCYFNFHIWLNKIYRLYRISA